MSQKNSGDRIVFRDDTRIGHVAAEYDDSFLFDCFVDNPALTKAMDLDYPGMILSGRTGSGKTAILRYIASRQENTAEIDPAELSIQYISNSDIFQFLNDIGADLDLFFQIIWKHVITIQYVKLRYSIGDRYKYDSFINRIINKFSEDATKRRAIEYLKEWGQEFWINIDENVKSITERYEREISASLDIDIYKTRTKAGFGRNLSRDQKTEYVRRARKIIDGRQLADLSKVLDLFSGEGGEGGQASYYILIDKLDERWADDSIKFRLVRALIETLKSFRKIRNLKIVAALRSDVIERSIQENTDAGFQREKFDDYVIRIRWTEQELKRLVNKRITKLFSWKYTKNNVMFEDIFTPQIPPNRSTFSYISDRTLLRPRDVLSFVNFCFETAEGQTVISVKNVRTAEQRYSAARLNAMLDEWETAFPSLKHIFAYFSGQRSQNTLSEIAAKEVLDEMALPISADAGGYADPLAQSASTLIEGRIPHHGQISNFAKEVVSVLYRVGAIGVKRLPNERYLYCYKDEPNLVASSLPDDVKFRFHFMLIPALNMIDDRAGKSSDRR